jgi:ABC-type multidrug transport system fused ATPase/permease subunit
MSNDEVEEGDDAADEPRSVPLRRLLELARPHRARLIAVLVLTGLGTILALVEPLIYRAAVNDVAGVFVGDGGGVEEEGIAAIAEEGEEGGAKPSEPASTERGPAPLPPPASSAVTAAPPAPPASAIAASSAAPPPRASRPHPDRWHHRPKHPRWSHRHRGIAPPPPASSAASPLPALSPQLGLPHPGAPVEPHSRGRVAPRTPEQMFVALLWAVFFLFLTTVGSRLFDIVADNLCTAAGNTIERNLVVRTFRHVLALPQAFFADRPSGALARQIDQSDQVAPIVSGFVRELAPEIFLVVGIVAIMFRESHSLALVALATLPAYLLVAQRSVRRLESGLPEYYERWERVASRIQETLATVKTVKLSGAEEREAGRLDAASAEAYAAYLGRNRLANRYLFLQSILAQTGKALVLGFGGWKVLEHQLTPGDVVMFVAYLDRLYDPIDTLSSLSKSLQQNLASIARAFRLLDAPGRELGGSPFPKGEGRVELHDVRFSYDPARPVLRGVAFTLEPGTVTALVGPSGSGKTTLVDLLLRLRDPDGGEILIDGVPLGSIDRSEVRRAIGLVAADGSVLRGTLAENIRYKRPEATDDEVRAAALEAGLGPTLERLPEGLDTEVGEQGVGLSVGERQRLQLARAFVSEPRILVLDEATANLDYATEGEIRDVLERMRGGRTTLVVAHRFSMVAIADQAIVLEEGRVSERGHPSELLRSGGWLARMAASQGEQRNA